MQLKQKNVATLAVYQRNSDDLNLITFAFFIYISIMLYLLLLEDYCTELNTILDYTFCLIVGGVVKFSHLPLLPLIVVKNTPYPLNH